MAQSVDFINPNRKWEIYGSMGYLALAAGTLFTRHQAVKIIGTTVLSGSASLMAANFIVSRSVCKHLKNDDVCLIRSENRVIHSIGVALHSKLIGFFTVIGAMFSLTSRVPVSFLKRKVSLNQFAPVWISSLALTVLAIVVGVCQNKNRGALEYRMLFCWLTSIVLINMGIIAYRTGSFSKKPS